MGAAGQIDTYTQCIHDIFPSVGRRSPVSSFKHIIAAAAAAAVVRGRVRAFVQSRADRRRGSRFLHLIKYDRPSFIINILHYRGRGDYRRAHSLYGLSLLLIRAATPLRI